MGVTGPGLGSDIDHRAHLVRFLLTRASLSVGATARAGYITAPREARASVEAELSDRLFSSSSSSSKQLYPSPSLFGFLRYPGSTKVRFLHVYAWSTHTRRCCLASSACCQTMGSTAMENVACVNVSTWLRRRRAKRQGGNILRVLRERGGRSQGK